MLKNKTSSIARRSRSGRVPRCLDTLPKAAASNREPANPSRALTSEESRCPTVQPARLNTLISLLQARDGADPLIVEPTDPLEHEVVKFPVPVRVARPNGAIERPASALRARSDLRRRELAACAAKSANASAVNASAAATAQSLSNESSELVGKMKVASAASFQAPATPNQNATSEKKSESLFASSTLQASTTSKASGKAFDFCGVASKTAAVSSTFSFAPATPASNINAAFTQSRQQGAYPGRRWKGTWATLVWGAWWP